MHIFARKSNFFCNKHCINQCSGTAKRGFISKTPWACELCAISGGPLCATSAHWASLLPNKRLQTAATVILHCHESNTSLLHPALPTHVQVAQHQIDQRLRSVPQHNNKNKSCRKHCCSQTLLSITTPSIGRNCRKTYQNKTTQGKRNVCQF